MGRFNGFVDSIDEIAEEEEDDEIESISLSDAGDQRDNPFGQRADMHGSGIDSSDDEDEFALDQELSDIAEDDILESKEFGDRNVSSFRFCILALMIGGIVAAGVGSWKFLKNAEYQVFLNEFDDVSNSFVHQINENVARILSETHNVATTITAISDATHTQWPFFTDRNFHVIGSNFRSASLASEMAIAPLVAASQIEEWKNYTLANQGWIQESLEWEAEMEGAPLPAKRSASNITGDISNIVNGKRTPIDASDGLFCPIWQVSRAPQDPSVIVNSNAKSNPTFARILETIETFNEPVLAGQLRLDELLSGEQVPSSMLVYPLVKEFGTDDIVGTIIAFFSWDVFFAVQDHHQVPTISAVAMNECGEEFTLQLKGNTVAAFSAGDTHDNDYDAYEVQFKFAPFLRIDHGDNNSPVECDYTISLYPTDEFLEAYTTKTPTVFACILVGALLLGSIIFCLYDCAVHSRQQRILAIATQSEKILSVLYPKTIRERLFGAGQRVAEDPYNTYSTNEEEEQQPKSSFSQTLNLSNRTKKKVVMKNMPPYSARYQMKTFINDFDISNRSKGTVQVAPLENSNPIADLFPRATVLFADIAGFTAWSSVREPKHVFTLLETVYASFDALAKRRRVFKVETVGDCYVAVTGLPEPRDDHAILMCRFARDCVQQFNELAGQLETTLGPDTADLAVRVGIHSGPVTAGVLRGDKSRFQLFGDTVNTAARIESGGQRNRIHLSLETAGLIIEAGKEHWLKRREDVIEAKGKGKLQTYWLLFKNEQFTEDAEEKSETSETEIVHDEFAIMSEEFKPSTHSRQDLSSELSDFEEATAVEIQATLPLKITRLVRWNVDVLSRLLTQIVAKREAIGARRNNDAALTRAEDDLRNKHRVLDEVVESIPLPAFNQRIHNRQEQITDSIELPDAVIGQLTLYVYRIAAYHKEGNAFHNFEHASHVMMSVSKLLARIISIDDGDLDGNSAHNAHDHTYGITSDPMTQFSVVLAALIHDVDHSGVSNPQLIKENHDLATIYEGKSIAEQNSIVLAWDTLMEPRFYDLRRCIYSDPDELQRFRQLMTNTVLATDIFDSELQRLRKERWEKAFSLGGSGRRSMKEDTHRKATIVMEHLIQASDVAHTMQHWHVYRKWNERLFVEMANAYKAGRMEKNPADFWYQGELAFFDNYVIPLAYKLRDCGVFGVSSDEYLNYALANRRHWERKGEKVLAEFVRKHQNQESHDESRALDV